MAMEDAAKVGHFKDYSAEEARQNGLLTAQYSAEWADYLTTNSCTFLDRDC